MRGLTLLGALASGYSFAFKEAGIGRGIALKLAESGAKVAVHYYQNEGSARDTLAQVRERGSDGLVIQGDVTQPEQVQQLFERIRGEFDRLDVFVSNARPELPAEEADPRDASDGESER